MVPLDAYDTLQMAEQRCKTLVVQLGGKEAHIKKLESQAADASTKVTELSKLNHRLELELAAAQAKLEVQQAMTMELRSYMERQETMLPRQK